MADKNWLAAVGLRQLDAERFIDFASAIPPSIAECVRTLHRSFGLLSLTSATIKFGLGYLSCQRSSMELYLNKKEYMLIRFMAAAWSWYQVWGIFRSYRADNFPFTRRLLQRFVAGNGDANA